MILRVTDPDGTVVDLDFASLKFSEAEACERLTGWTHPEWRSALFEDRAVAVKFALWLAYMRAGRDVGTWDAFDPDFAAVTVELVIPAGDQAEAPGELGADEEGPTGRVAVEAVDATTSPTS